jgi:uncharacterized protein
MIIDAHCHIFEERYDVTYLLVRAEKNGIARICISCLGNKSYLPYPDKEDIKQANDTVIKAMEQFPGRVYGFCYLNPMNSNVIEELDRCVDKGMSGIKLWIARKAAEKEIFPIVEKSIEYNIPVLQHTWIKSTGNLKDESTPMDVVKLAEKFPEAKIIIAHMGGQWDLTLPVIKYSPNIFTDTCGGFPEQGMVERAVEEIGPERIIFGSDAPGRQFAVQLQKITAAKISRKAKEKILHTNILKLIGK